MRILFAVGANVAGTEVAIRVMCRACIGRYFLHLTLPGAFGAVRGYQHPGIGERVVAAMGVVVENMFHILVISYWLSGVTTLGIQKGFTKKFYVGAHGNTPGGI